MDKVSRAVVGDEIYFHHKDDPCCGKVLSVGKHGVTVDHEGKRQSVTWERVLGHKKRISQKLKIIHEGDDGMIVEDPAGKRRFVHIPPEAKEDQYMVKALADKRLLLFTKSEKIANRAGLHLENRTDRTGRNQKKWVRSNPEITAGNKRSKAKDPDPKDRRGSTAGYGIHNIEAVDRIQFKLGELTGEGEVVGNPGKDGAHVKDSSGHIHQVRWDQVTGHKAGPSTKKPEHERPVLGKQEPIHPDNFNASEYAKTHDKADVTPEEILYHFPEDTTDKITNVRDRLRSVEQTIDKYRQDGKYEDARKALHHQIVRKIMSPEKIKDATPFDGEKPVFIILGGRGGSGKSWFEGNVYDPSKFIVLDADHIKGMLPEYEGWNAHQVHEESGDIFDELVKTARFLGLNVVLDKTMKTAKSSIADVHAFKDAGYRTEAHYMHLPRQEAAKRAVARFLGKTKRFVPPEVVLSNTTNEHSFDQVKHLVDDWSFRDNNVQQGQQPILISMKKAIAKLTKAISERIIVFWRCNDGKTQ
ncbi:zeta toxin family protein [Nitrosomonas sp. Nm132]|uniref:zeta toxin family protein n=1 Tax=Nitrosomonas sp. Nm132 TaxID=1881053 RepID=UPI000883D46B|nr:zeta toxin family protein [Nitrosomonas sp. Nm132]SDH26784.1 Predicted ABC-type ATPase [Nitrosomonas sp. Nm132]